MFKFVISGLSLSTCLFFVRFILSAANIPQESDTLIVTALYGLTNTLVIPEEVVYKGAQILTKNSLPPAQILLPTGGLIETCTIFNMIVFSIGIACILGLNLADSHPSQRLSILVSTLQAQVFNLMGASEQKPIPINPSAHLAPPSPFLSQTFGTNMAASANATSLPPSLSMNNCIPSYQGQMREVSILFCDIRGYTALVEKYPPHLVIHQLNEYFTAMTQVIFQNRGRLDKYMGDGLMAFFEPTNGSIASSAINSVRAAQDMEQVLRQLNKKWKQEGLPVLDIGIGINSGVVFIGNIGSHMKMDFTIIGDNVNLAARLEQMNKVFNTRIIVSESTWRWVKEDASGRYLGQVPVRGKQKQVKVYEILDQTPKPVNAKSLRAAVQPLHHALAQKVRAGH